MPFTWHTKQVYAKCVKSAIRQYFVVLVCFSFSWGQHYSVLALNIVDSSVLVFIPIVPSEFEQVLPNLSSFNQSTFLQAWENQSNLRNQRNIRKVLFESSFPNLVVFWLCLFVQIKINSIFIIYILYIYYIYILYILYILYIYIYYIHYTYYKYILYILYIYMIVK